MTRSILFTALMALTLVINAHADQPATTENRDAYGNTALMIAAAYGDLETVQQLIDDGAQVNARGRIGNTALIYAAQEGHSQIVDLLIKAGADVEAHNQYNATARKLAQGLGYQDIANRLQIAEATAAKRTKDLI